MELQSSSIGEVALALAKARPEFQAILKTKNGRSGNQHYKYADLSDILDSVVPVLSKSELCHTQTSGFVDGKFVLITTLIHKSGEWIRGLMPIACRNFDDPKAMGSAITYARRYALCGILGISADHDDDGAAAGHPQSSKKGQSQRPPQRKRPTVDQLAEQASKDFPKITGNSKLMSGDYLIEEKWKDLTISEAHEWQNKVVNAVRAGSAKGDPVDFLLSVNGEARALIFQARKHHRARHEAKDKYSERRGQNRALQKQIAGQ